MIEVRHTKTVVAGTNPAQAEDWNAAHTITGLAAVAESGAYGDLEGIPATFAPAAHTHVISDIANLATTLVSLGSGVDAVEEALGGYQPLSPVLTATTASFTAADDTKLAGIAAGATANATDAALRARSSHTGTQSASTITGLASVATSGAYGDLIGLPALFDGAYSSLTAVPATFPPTAHSHVIADVTGLQAALDGKQPLSTVLTNTTASFTTAQQTKLSGIATGATANAADAQLRDRATHSGVQAISTVTGLQAALDAKQAALVSGNNIKTVNGTSLLGAGDLAIGGGGGGGISDAPVDGNTYLRQDGGWVLVPRLLNYITLIDQTKTDDGTYTADPYLQSETLEPNSFYRFEVMVLQSSDAATDLKFRVARTGLDDADLRFAGDLDNNSAVTSGFYSPQNLVGAGTSVLRAGNWIGTLKTGDVLGTVVFEWGQQTSGPAASTLNAGSMLLLRKIA